MNRSASWKLISLRGVDLRIHFSLLILLLYIVIVGAAQFPFVVEGAGVSRSDLSGSPLAWGMIFALSLLISVALHEFGHAFTAQALGMKVRGITLMMLGGVSEMDRISDARYAEFKLAIVGPIVSLTIAALMFLLRVRSESAELSLYGYWLGRANLVLAIFNLLPAFPLDGGRALRSVLAVRQGALQATQTSVKISRAFAWALGLLGLISFNILLILIALFIYNAAENELLFAMSMNLMGGLTAGQAGTHTAVIQEDEFLVRVAHTMRMSRNSALPVQTASGVPAMIFLDGIARVSQDLWPQTRVQEVMVPVEKVIDVNDPMSQILPDLLAANERVLPLKSEGRLMGVIRYSDVSQVVKFRSIEGKETTDRAA